MPAVNSLPISDVKYAQYGPRKYPRRGIVNTKSSKPILYWDRLLRNIAQRAKAGLLTGVPWQWETTHHEPRCVRCGAVLTQQELTSRVTLGAWLRVAGCEGCADAVGKVLSGEAL